MKSIFGSVLAVSLWLAASAQAQVTINDAWVQAPAPGQQVVAAYMKIISKTNASLVSANSSDASSTTIHEMTIDKGVMKMRPLTRLELPAGKTTELTASGYHIMLEGLKRSLKEGDTVPITLTVEAENGRRQKIEVRAAVRSVDAVSGSAPTPRGRRL